eukprot:s291_g12.t1
MNVFQKLEMRRCGATPAFSPAHLNCLRLTRRWSFPNFGKQFQGSRQIRELLLLGPDAVCVMLHCDAEVWQVTGTGTDSTLQWLMGLRVFPMEKIIKVLHLRKSGVVLVYYTVGRRMDGVDPISPFRRVRLLEIPAMQRGERQERDCQLRETESSDLVHDKWNDCLWLVEESYISCWDDETLQPRFRIQEEPNLRDLRFGLGSFAQITSSHVSFFSPDNGMVVGKAALPGTTAMQIVEVLRDTMLLCKREHTVAVLVQEQQILCSLHQTEDWMPERVWGLPLVDSFLAVFPKKVQIWHYLHLGGLCWRGREIDAVGTCLTLNASISSALFPIEKQRGGWYSYDLNLLDLSHGHTKRRENPISMLRNVCHRRAIGGGGAWPVLVRANLQAGVVLVLGQGDLTCYAPES